MATMPPLRALVGENVERHVILIGADCAAAPPTGQPASTAPSPASVSLKNAVFELPSVMLSNPNVEPLLLFQ